MNALDFFQGQFSFPVDDSVIRSALSRRGTINESDEIGEYEQKEIELTLADILVILSRSSQGYTNRTGSDAFSMSIKGEYVPLADRRAMRDEANRIYRRYGESDKIRMMNAINVYEK